MKKFRKNINLIMILLFLFAVLCFWFGGFLSKWNEVGNIFQDMAVFVGIIPIFWLVLTKTKDGRRIKSELIDPYIKPSQEELRYWDKDGNLRKKVPHNSEKISKSDNRQKRLYLVISLAAFVILIIIAFILANGRGMDSMTVTGQGMDLLLNGLVHADFKEALEGGRILLSGIWMELQNILIMMVFVLLMFGIAFIVVRIRKKQRKYHFEENETEDKTEDKA